MELKGETHIAATREVVWTALNDPAVLARCIEGVESLDRTTDSDEQVRFDGKMNAKVGPVRATFTGGVTVTEPDPPHRYVLVGEGKGGVTGFAKGQAEVVLTDDGTGTLLSYVVTSSVGGKLAQLGSRLIEGTAKAYAATFFTRFKAEVEGPGETAADTFATAAGDSGLASSAAEAGLADTGLAEGGDASGSLTETGADPQALPGVEASRGGLPPIVWGTILVVLVAMVLAWQLL